MLNCKHLLVDGWNAIHSHPHLKRVLQEESQEAARALLLEMLSAFHDFGGVRLTIVYDGKGEQISIVRPYQTLTLSEVFTPSYLTADELIEQLCATSRNPSSILVATRDNLIRLTASSFKVCGISPEELFTLADREKRELGVATAEVSRKVQRQWKSHSPFDALDTLASDLKRAMGVPLVSKRLKRKMKKEGTYPKTEKPSNVKANEKKQKKSVKKDEKIFIQPTKNVQKNDSKKIRFTKTYKNLSALSHDILTRSIDKKSKLTKRSKHQR